VLVGVALLVAGAACGVGGDRLWNARFGGNAVHDKPPAHTPPPADEGEEPEPAAVVRTVVAVAGSLHPTVEALGMAAVPPAATVVESWPTDVIVTAVLVQPGEAVVKDSPLVQVSMTRDAETQLAAAQLALENSAKSLEVAQQRLDRSLGTRTELIAAQGARDEAKQRLDRLQAGFPPKDRLLRAHSPGIVGTLRVQAGGTVPAGTPIVDITSDAAVAQIGIDPAETAGLSIGQVFDVRSVDDRAADGWKGTLSLIARTVNPSTRLVDATLTLAGGPLPRVGTPLRAKAVVPGAAGVIVPRAALVPDGDSMVVFVVRDGTAVRTPVTVAQRGSEQVALAGGCAPGDHVVVSGQNQLSPGATVRETTAPPERAKNDGGAGADR
jgi:RND family efflux transporter MFP subunit